MLVVLVIFIFLQSFRATVIPLLAVPVSLLGTFAAFTVLGFTINTLTLFAMVLAIGLVVDDAIVVIENVEHHMESGLEPVDATERAMDEVQGPVVAIAFVLAAVFVPVAFLGGMTGVLCLVKVGICFKKGTVPYWSTFCRINDNKFMEKRGSLL